MILFVFGFKKSRFLSRGTRLARLFFVNCCDRTNLQAAMVVQHYLKTLTCEDHDHQLYTVADEPDRCSKWDGSGESKPSNLTVYWWGLYERTIINIDVTIMHNEHYNRTVTSYW